MNNSYPQTPCYIIHKEALLSGISRFRKAMEAEWKNCIIGYSFKTNALPYVLQVMKEVGFYAEVVSEDEYDLAVYMGFSNIIYNGPVKGKRSFLQALSRESIINLDAERELLWLEEALLEGLLPEGIRAKIGIRVNFNLEADCPGETSGGTEGSRFGFSYETGELKKAIDRLERMHIPLAGLHLHASSKTRSLNIYKALARMACTLKEEYGLHPAYVDIGGGYFGGMENKPQFEEYMKCIKETLQKAYKPEETVLIAEPGTSLITPPVEYITTVVDCKDTYAGRFVITDGSRSDVDPLHGKSAYFYRIERKKNGRQTVGKQVVCGYTCMENDRLFVLEEEEALLPGDRILYQKVGGYTMCLTPLFICYFPAVYVEEEGKLTCVREHWKEQEYVQKCVDFKLRDQK